MSELTIVQDGVPMARTVTERPLTQVEIHDILAVAYRVSVNEPALVVPRRPSQEANYGIGGRDNPADGRG